MMMFSGIDAFNLWKAEEFMQALSALYWGRSFKPILHPVLSFFPLVLNGGDVRAAVAAVNITLFSIFILYLYGVLRFFLSREYSSIGACFIGLLPWVVRSAVSYSAELPVLTAGTASIYYLLKSDFFRSRNNCFFLGLTSGLAFCFHPPVAAIGLGAALLVHSINAAHNGALRFRDIGMVGAILLSHLVMGIAMHWAWINGTEMRSIAHAQAVFLIVFFAFWIGMSFYGKFSTTYLLFVALVVFMVNAWYLPFLSMLYLWVRAGFIVPHGGFMWTFRMNLYEDVFAIFGRHVLLIACLIILWEGIKIGFLEKGRNDRLKEALPMFLSLVLLPPIIGSLTHNKDLRYYYFYFTMAYAIGVIVLCQSGGGFFQKALRKGCLLLGILSAVMVLRIIFQWNIPWLVKIADSIGYAPYNTRDSGIIPTPSAQPALDVVGQVFETIPPGPTGLTGIAAFWDLHPEELDLICRERQKRIVFENAYVREDRSTEDVVFSASKNYPFLIVGPCEDPGQMKRTIPRDRARFEMNRALCRQWREGILPASGFERVMEIQTSESLSPFLLLRSRNWQESTASPSNPRPF